MSLAEVTARLAGELGELRARHAALRHDLDRAIATIAERGARIDELIAERAAAKEVLDATARRLEAAESARAEAERRSTAARAAADRFRAERDQARAECGEMRRLAWDVIGLLEVIEGATRGGLLRRGGRQQGARSLPEDQVVLTVALGLRRAALAPVVAMLRTQAARTPLLLAIDHDLGGALDPAPAGWLRLPKPRELPWSLGADRRDEYLRARLAKLIEVLRPATVVRLGPAAARLLDRR
jgi:hypothetical protein